MKKYLYILVLLTITVLQACDSNDIDTPHLEDDYPRILGRWPDPKNDGTLGIYEAPIGKPFSIILQFTPSNLCEGTWFLDGKEYSKGTTFEYLPTTPGTHDLKLVVKTDKYTTTREATLVCFISTTS